MKKEEILNLLEDEVLNDEQNYISSIGSKKIHIGSISGKIYRPRLDFSQEHRKF